MRGAGDFWHLTHPAIIGYTDSMITITESLKQALAECGLSQRRLERESGVNRNSIFRFMEGRTGLSLEQAEMLAAYFGLVLVPESQVKKPRKG